MKRKEKEQNGSLFEENTWEKKLELEEITGCLNSKFKEELKRTTNIVAYETLKPAAFQGITKKLKDVQKLSQILYFYGIFGI